MRTFSDIADLAARHGPARIAVACAQDADVLSAVRTAAEQGVSDAVLVGDREAILREALAAGYPPEAVESLRIVDVEDPADACLTAVELVSSNRADILMKGLVDTSILLKAVLNPEKGLRTGGILSHVGVFRVPGVDRFFFLSDAAMNIAPDVRAKAEIIRNAVAVAHALGMPNPLVAVLCAKEKVDPKMPATIDAAELCEMNRRGEITGCTVGGPFALDNAISPEAAAHKGITGPVAGRADILVVPNIETGNVLYKSMVFFARSEVAGVLMGARAPVVVTSRADSDLSKLNSIALAVLLSKQRATASEPHEETKVRPVGAAGEGAGT